MTDTQAWEQAIEIGRWTNIVLGTAALVMVPTAVRGWRYRSAGNRFLWLGVAVLMANVVFGTAEQIYDGVDGGWRTAVTTVGTAYLLAALILKWRGRWHENDRPYGGSFNSRES